MSEKQINNPLHGMTLEMILNRLVEHYGWGELGIHVRIRCFNSDPSVKSSLTFLRKTPWARTKVENLYIAMLDEKEAEKKSPWSGLNKPTG
ncbi:MAG: VF530 family protein [Mariprofundus sp.]|nr:VF530 family protein [Mariprofundus sp.]